MMPSPGTAPTGQAATDSADARETDALRGTVAIVTGSSRGLGRAVALALATRGVRVAAVARTADALAELVSAAAPLSGSIVAVPADVTAAPTAFTAVRHIRESLGVPTVLVCAAGVGAPFGPFADVDIDAWWETVSVNLLGTAVWCRAVLPYMREAGRGRIVNVASGAGTRAIPHMSAYVASKAGVIRLTEVIAAELSAAREPVSVVAIEPGTIRTAMTESAMASPEGRRWLPWLSDVFARGGDTPMQDAVRFILELVAGRADQLHGQFVVNDRSPR